MSVLFPGGPIPLFDKLDQRTAPPGHESGQGLSADGVEASVERELHRLLNSRSRISLTEFTDAGLTVLDYGIPDYTALSARSENDRSRIARAIERAISYFEPRLSHTVVTPLGAANGITIALFQIDADLAIAQTVRRVRFTLAAETPDATQLATHAPEAVA
ncbi:MAG: type VI secretion system baseplate subunit TssE [Burkholderiaceae bacterium]